MSPPEPLLDRRQAARFLGFSVSHLDRLVGAGLPALDFSPPGSKRKTLRFDPAALREWAHERAKA